MIKNRYTILVTLVFLLVSCDTTVQRGSSGHRILPNVTGGAGEVLVVMDNYNWEHAVGELTKNILKDEYPALPQSEPLFDVTHITSSSFDNMFRYHRSVVLVTVNESQEKPAVRFRKNVWAKPQIVVQVQASGSHELLQAIGANRNKIQQFLVQNDRERLMQSYEESKDLEIEQKMTEHHQIRLSIPRGYNIDFFKDDYSSVSIETPDYSQVIHVFEYPASGPEDLATDLLISKRNEFCREYVQGPTEDSYMTTSKIYPPEVYDLEMEDKKVVEIRGLWDLVNGFMGGPFVSHSIFDAKRNRIVTVEGYVYYPNQEKRVKIKQLEAIIYSLEII